MALIKKVLGYSVLFLSSIILLTGILYLTVWGCSVLGVFNEHIFCCLLGVLFSVIVMFSENKLVSGFKLTKTIYLLSTVFVPAVIYNVVYIIFRYSNNAGSLLDKDLSEVSFYLIFMSYALAVASAIVALIKLTLFLIKNRNWCSNH